MSGEGTEFNDNFSETELEIISYLKEHPEMSYKDIAHDRGVSRGTINYTVARVRSKTRDAFATLLESPHTAEVAEELEGDDVEYLIDVLQESR